MTNGFCTCLKCGRVSMGITQEEAEQAIKDFNDWYYNQPKEVQELYGGPSSLDDYRCFCGNKDATAYRDFKKGNCPEGVTISPVIRE